MNTTYDKRTKLLIVGSVVALLVLAITVLGVFLFKQKDVAPDDSDAAVIETAWEVGDTWKKFETKEESFPVPSNFKRGTVKIEAQWAWSGNIEGCEVQVNESHEVIIPGLDKKIIMEDRGDARGQEDCTEVIQQLRDMGYDPGPFNLPHVVDNDDSTWFPANPKSVTGEWDESMGPLEVTIKFTGMDGPPEEWCDRQNGTMPEDKICNGSHKYRVRVIWNAVEDTPTPTPTPTNSPTPTPTPAPLKANIGDYVWVDVNMDGIQDSTEDGLAGVTVNLMQEGSATPVATTTTDNEGKYSFLNIDAGSYYLVFESKTGYVRTIIDQGGDTADSDANVETGATVVTDLEENETDNSWDAGYYLPYGSIGDCVWQDTDKDGIQDTGETTGVAGVDVNLYTSTNTSTAIDTKVTDSQGCYLFEEVDPGNYVIKFELPVGYAVSPKTQGSDTCVDSDPDAVTGFTDTISLGSGESDLCWDAGLYRLNADIQIIKSEKADHETATDYQIVALNAQATFHVKVINTGEIDLKDVVVTDALATACSRDVSELDLTTSPVGILEVGESASYTCQSSAVTASFTNVAEVRGTPIDNSADVTDEDDSDVVLAGTPAIKVQKSEQANHSTAKDTQTVAEGGNAVFYITVTNIGAVALKDVSVTDPLAAGCVKALTEDDSSDTVLQASLAVGESKSYQCSNTTATTSFINVATVTGKSVDTDQVVTDNDPSTVVVPGEVNVNKYSSMTCDADQSSTVTYSLEIENPSSESRVLVVSDVLDDKVDSDVLSVDSISDGGVYNSGTNEITWSNVTLAGNSSKTFTYEIVVDNSNFGEYVNTVIVKQDGIEVGRDIETLNVLCLPATGILADNSMRIVVPAIVVVTGIMFVALKGHLYVGRLLTKGSGKDSILED